MNVRFVLETLNERIKDIYPKSSDVTAKSEKERITQKSLIEDIQRRFAEIYAIIEREVASEDLNIDYDEARIKYPERIKSILNLISVLALTIKTKLNINDTEKVFNLEYIKRIDRICFECYKIELSLSGKPDTNAYEVYSKGISAKVEYVDYKTGFKRFVSPGDVRGKLVILGACSVDIQTRYMTMVTNTIEKLDQGVKLPHLEERFPLIYSHRPSGTNLQPLPVIEYRNPRSLFQTTVNFLQKNRIVFFKKLVVLPPAITEKVPELDISYKHKFCVAVKKIISGVSFIPSPKEKEYLDQLSLALAKENPYNAVHPILEEIRKINAQAFLTEFASHMRPIREAIIGLMKQYNDDKAEYVKYFGNTL